MPARVPELPPRPERAPAAPPDAAEEDPSEDDEHAATAVVKTKSATNEVLMCDECVCRHLLAFVMGTASRSECPIVRSLVTRVATKSASASSDAA